MANEPAPEVTVPKCATFADFVRMLNDGSLHRDLTEALLEINAALNNHAQDNAGAIAKGKLSLSIDFKLKGGVFEINADFATKLPKEERERTIAWSTTDNFFTPQNPRQTEMFGPRGVVDAYGSNGGGSLRQA